MKWRVAAIDTATDKYFKMVQIKESVLWIQNDSISVLEDTLTFRRDKHSSIKGKEDI